MNVEDQVSSQNTKAKNAPSEKPGIVSGDALILNVAILSGLLPILLVGSVGIFFHWDFQQPSLSDYVYTAARPFFYGVLFTLGVVLFFYQGYPRNDGPIPLTDNQLASIAALGALMVAIFPTSHCYGGPASQPVNIYRSLVWGHIHLLGALICYGSMAVFFLFYFTQSGGADESHLRWNKVVRNRIYKACGCVIVAVMLILFMAQIYRAIADVPKCYVHNRFSYVFWFELVMQAAVVVGWGTKYWGRKMNS